MLWKIILSLLCIGSSVQSQSIEGKVGQLFVAYFEGEQVNLQAKRLIRDAKIGGIIYYNWSNGLDSPEQVRALSAGLQRCAQEQRIEPLLIAVDQEGGRVQRLRSGFTESPGNAALARKGDPQVAYSLTKQMASELRSVGVNLNFAPVVDVNNNPLNPVIGERSFGADPKLVTAFGEASLKGFSDGGVIPCLKHFPGHGDVTMDSHLKQPVVDKDKEELLEVELYPYQRLASTAPMIMTAHILFPKLDACHCATLSPTILIELLRGDLGYDGVLITDSLTMEGVLEGRPLEEVALDAFLAGNDLLLIGGRDLDSKIEGDLQVDEVIRVVKYFTRAVRDGVITDERLNTSLDRIAALKRGIV